MPPLPAALPTSGVGASATFSVAGDAGFDMLAGFDPLEAPLAQLEGGVSEDLFGGKPLGLDVFKAQSDGEMCPLAKMEDQNMRLHLQASMDALFN